MAFVERYGNTVSEDGWRMVDEAECNWITVRGTDVSLEIRKGIPTVILGEFAARFNEQIEPLRDPDSACWTDTNDVPTSNHMAATAEDLNWDSHPFHVRGTFGDRLPALLGLLDEFRIDGDPGVWWGGWWDDPIDEMHFQLNWAEGDPRNDALAAKLQAAAPPPPANPRDAAAAEIFRQCALRGWGRDRAVPCASTGIQESNLDQDATDPTGHRGVYQQDGGYPNRETMVGNIAGFFERLDAKLASPGASPDIWKNIFWLQQRPSEPSADAAYANGRQHYLTEIQSHIDEANTLYDRLAAAPPPPPPPPAPGDAMAQVPQEQWDTFYQAFMDLYHQLTDPLPSESALRTLGEGNVGSVIKLMRNTDGNVWTLLAHQLAILGDPEERSKLAHLRDADPIQYPDRQNDAVLAATILARTSEQPAPTPPYVPPPVTYTPPPAPPVPAVPNTPKPDKTTGQIIGDLYESLAELKLADSLPIEARAPLAALIEVLTLKNGSQLK